MSKNDFSGGHSRIFKRTDKANFGPSVIGLICSVKVNHYIQCTNITFIWISSIFCHFCGTVFKVTSKLANLH